LWLKVEPGDPPQTLKDRFISHPSFSGYTFLWSLSYMAKQGVAMLVKTTLMDVQPPPTVSYTLYDNEPDKTIGGCVRTGCKVSDSRVIKVRAHSRLAIRAPPRFSATSFLGCSLDNETKPPPPGRPACEAPVSKGPRQKKEAEKSAQKYPA
jgi:hypothetical protein